MADKKLRKQLRVLGAAKVKYPRRPSKDILEVFNSPSRGNEQNSFFYVRFDQDAEFTSLCPLTSQPDFANIRIIYVPNHVCVESKSLKLYLFSYRNYGGFGEKITNRIADDLFDVLSPRWIAVVGEFRPRGGISWTTTAVRVQSPDYLTPLDVQQIAQISQRRLT